ncbi:MAG TPA: DUF4169 family protein [Acetobacteraceae bacterium]|nr:DUF4169 family protein [Acetobacteraceae bacterium]
MGDIINLRQARKQHARESARQGAQQNRARHGRTAVAKANDRRAAERMQAVLSGKRLEPQDRS